MLIMRQKGKHSLRTTKPTKREQKDSLAGTGIRDKRGEISVFPNPSTGIFNVIASSGSAERSLSADRQAISLNIEIYNVLGEKVFTSTLPPPTGGGVSVAYNINISSQPNGLYLYRVISENGELVGEGKFVISK